MIATTGIEIFDALVAALKAGQSGDIPGLYERLWSLPSKDIEDLLYLLNMKRSDDKSLVVGYHNGRTLPAFEQQVAAAGSLQKVRGLVLIPFCLQEVDCEHKIIWDPDNCRRCCACAVGPLEELAEELNWPLRVCARARFAPRFTKEVKPDLVVSLACPHETFAGLMRVRDVPVYAFTLATPEGYCRNTRADLAELADFTRALGFDWKPSEVGEHKS